MFPYSWRWLLSILYWGVWSNVFLQLQMILLLKMALLLCVLTGMLSAKLQLLSQRFSEYVVKCSTLHRPHLGHQMFLFTVFQNHSIYMYTQTALRAVQVHPNLLTGGAILYVILLISNHFFRGFCLNFVQQPCTASTGWKGSFSC